MNEKNNHKKEMAIRMGGILLLFLGCLAFFSARWYITEFGDTGFDSILYTLFSEMSGTDSAVIRNFLLTALLPALVAFVVLTLFFWARRGNGEKIYPFTKKRARILSLILSAVMLLGAAVTVDLPYNVMPELTKIAAREEPFAFTMLTVDTHRTNGYVCRKCVGLWGEQYENVISCSSKQVDAFIRWVKQQDFYENTTIIIVGDHVTMDEGYIDRNVAEEYERTVLTASSTALWKQPMKRTDSSWRRICSPLRWRLWAVKSKENGWGWGRTFSPASLPWRRK